VRLAAPVAAGLAGQAVLLVAIAGVRGACALAVLGAGGLAAAAAAAAWPRLRPGASASLLMLSLGGLGMALGWWADLGFASAAALLRAAPEAMAAGAWCGLAPLRPGAHAAPGLHLASWMNAGMLAAGGLAMAAGSGRARRCGLAALLTEALGMLLGMSAGASLAARGAAALPVEAAVGAAHLLMLGGMLAGAATAQCLASLLRTASWICAERISQIQV
jgi:hypothetical protein